MTTAGIPIDGPFMLEVARGDVAKLASELTESLRSDIGAITPESNAAGHRKLREWYIALLILHGIFHLDGCKVDIALQVNGHNVMTFQADGIVASLAHATLQDLSDEDVRSTVQHMREILNRDFGARIAQFLRMHGNG